MWWMVVMSLHQHQHHWRLKKWWISHHRIYTSKMGLPVQNRGPNTNNTSGSIPNRPLNTSKRVSPHPTMSLSTPTKAW